MHTRAATLLVLALTSTARRWASVNQPGMATTASAMPTLLLAALTISSILLKSMHVTCSGVSTVGSPL